jgi:uncharacterized damage-inducible protein DinB
MVMSDPRLQQLVDGLAAAHRNVLAAIEGISEEDAHQVPREGEWTVAQLLAHIAEIQIFWSGKAQLITREEDPNITRSDVENDVRLAAVTDHSHDCIAHLTDGIVNAQQQAIATVKTFRPEDLDRLGHRGENNPMNVAGVIEYLTGHIEEHAGQIIQARRLIAQRDRGEGADAGQS